VLALVIGEATSATTRIDTRTPRIFILIRHLNINAPPSENNPENLICMTGGWEARLGSLYTPSSMMATLRLSMSEGESEETRDVQFAAY